MKRLLMMVLVSVISVSVSSGANAKSEMTSFGQAMEILFKRPISVHEHKTVAKGFQDKCKELDRKIPALSPSESAWVKAEIKAGRIEAVYGSLEFAKRQAKQSLRNCYAAAEHINSDALKSPDDRNTAWAQLVSAILDHTLLDHMANIKKSSPVKLANVDITAISMFPMLAKFMVDGILVPRLKRRAKAN